MMNSHRLTRRQFVHSAAAAGAALMSRRGFGRITADGASGHSHDEKLHARA